MLELSTDIQFLKGIGEKRAMLFHRLKIYTVGDLLAHYPRSYIDTTSTLSILGATTDMPCAVRAVVVHKSGEQRVRGGLSIHKVQVCDEEGTNFVITFFNSKYTVEKLAVESEYIFFGKVTGGFSKKEMNTPMVVSLLEAKTLLPVYDLTAGLTSKGISNCVKTALALLESLPETLPPEIIAKYELCPLDFATRSIHFPSDMGAMQSAKVRLIFEELFTLSLALSAVRRTKLAETAAVMGEVNLAYFYKSLPYELTSPQTAAIDDITADLMSGRSMNRLLQGDVGSGKTVVAAAACFFATKNGLQSAMMAPTEILAEQHFNTFSSFLGPLGVNVGILTGSMKAKQKNEVKAKLADGSLDLIVGTHALISAGIEFAGLGLVITDEQHRFGVDQRIALGKKGERPHTLVMSATPIPRTLSLIIYGDLDISVIDAMPIGRLPVKTYAIDSAKRARAYNFIRSFLDKGQQGYIVCPLVEMGEEDFGLLPATEYAAEISGGEFLGYSVGLLHGKMKPKEKEATMQNFKNGEIQLLVATTVIEVGVDVPNAVIILIENAERFGLSQLHQLRGRVGRGAEQSHCILLSDSRGEESRRRLQTMCKTNSGFSIAEQDLAMRGPGDFFGSRQHGLPQLRIADLVKDETLLANAQQCAADILEEDRRLELPKHHRIRAKVFSMLRDIGGRPN